MIRAVLLETVKDNHGYYPSSIDQITWSPDKNLIPFAQNPFVGGSPAFNSWLNDGETTRRFRKDLYVGTPDEESFMMTVDDYVKEREWVCIPTLWNQMPRVFRVTQITGGPSQVRGTPQTGDYSLALADLVAEDGKGPRELRNVGLAFLKRAASKTKDMSDALNNADEFMSSWERPQTRSRRDEPSPESVGAREPERRVIRRVGGVAAPPEPRRPAAMSGDEVRDMLGLRRRE